MYIFYVYSYYIFYFFVSKSASSVRLTILVYSGGGVILWRIQNVINGAGIKSYHEGEQGIIGQLYVTQTPCIYIVE